MKDNDAAELTSFALYFMDRIANIKMSSTVFDGGEWLFIRCVIKMTKKDRDSRSWN